MNKTYKAVVSLALAIGICLQMCISPVFAVGNTSAMPAEGSTEAAAIVKLQTEYMDNPLGIDVEKPRFSWQMQSAVTGQKQTAYQILVAESAADLAAGPYAWDSGKVDSGKSVDIRYGGKDPLEASTRYYWKVKVWDKDGAVVESTEEAWFETGLMCDTWEDVAWSGATWIASPSKSDLDNPEYYPDETENTRYNVESDLLVRKNFDGYQNYADVGMAWGYNDHLRSMYGIRLSFNYKEDKIKLALEYYSACGARKRDSREIRSVDLNKDVFKASEMGGKPFHVKVELDELDFKIYVSPDSSKENLQEVMQFLHTTNPGQNPLPEGDENERTAKGLCCGVGYYHSRSGNRGTYGNNLEVTDMSDPQNPKQVFKETFDDPRNTRFGDQLIEVVMAEDIPFVDESVNKNKGDGWVSVTGCAIATETAFSDEVAPMFRKEFSADKGEIKSARLYASAAGIYEYYINGQKVNDSYFNPGNTAYRTQTDYQTFDVTDLVKSGQNAIGAYLGHGWYDRATSGHTVMGQWGAYLALFGKLVVTYENGEPDVIVTDKSWSIYEDGPIRFNDIWQGEVYDATKEVAGWNQPGFTGSGWIAAAETARAEYYGSAFQKEEFKPFGVKNAEHPDDPNKLATDGYLKAQSEPPIRAVKTLEPVKADTEAKAGAIVYDFGQEITGICRITVKGKAGDMISLHHGEWLNEKDMIGRDGPVGTVWTSNLLGAQALDRYILKGDANGEVFEPSFTFHGFRYMEIDLPDSVEIVKVEGLALSSDLETTGSFECSNKSVNQAFSNAMWSQIDNFIGIPVDCPQRTERYGWMGDAQIFSHAASYNANVEAFYSNYIRIIRSQQFGGENYEYTVSDMYPRDEWWGMGQNYRDGGNIWGDALIIIPWNLYQQYGSTALIEDEHVWEGMVGWIDHIYKESEKKDGALYRRNEAYGDHLSLEGYDNTKDIVNSAYAAHVCDLMSKMATATGRTEEAAKFAGYFEEYKDGWNKLWVKEDGWTGKNEQGNGQTLYALGLQFNLYPEDKREKAAARLMDNIKQNKYHSLAGFAGIAYLNPALTETGNADAAYKLMEQEAYPAWLYTVTKGLTTIAEQWDGYKIIEGDADYTHSINGSLNHFSYGSFIEWLYRYSAGIERDEADPGFKHIILQPTLGGTFTYVNGSYDSAYGRIESNWTAKGGELSTYKAVVPANTTATLYLPVTKPQADAMGDIEGATFAGMEEHNGMACAKYTLESGSYEFKNYSAADGKELEEQAEAAKKEAEEARKEAEEAKKKAEEAKAAADEALKKVQEAQTKAEEARKAAEEAKKQADEKAQAAADSQKATEQQRKEAQAAKEQAQAAQAESAAAKKELETARAELKKAQEDVKAAKATAEKLDFQGRKAALSKVSSPKKKQLKVTWKKTAKAEGYQVQYALKSNFKGQKTLNVKGGSKTAATVKKLKSGKKYYVRVRAYKKIGGKTVYTAFSGKKSIKVK